MGESSKSSKRWRWFVPGQAVYSALEWWVMRLGFAWVLYGSFRLAGYDALRWAASPGRGYHSQPTPRGFAQFFDVSWVADPANAATVAAVVAAALVVFVIGIAPLLSSLTLLAVQTCIGTLEISQGGNVFHTSHILAICLLGMALAATYDYVQALAKGGISGLREILASRWQWPRHLLSHRRAILGRAANHLESLAERSRCRAIYTVQQVVAAAYVVSGISKLWVTKGAWMSQVENIGIQFLKNQRNEYYETLQPPPTIPWAVEFANNHPALATVFFSAGLWLEVLCFIALFNRAFLGAFGIALIVMHHFIALFMALYFPYNQWVLALFYVNVPFWILWAWKKCRHCHRAAGSAAGA